MARDRDIEAMVARDGPSQVVGEALQAQVHQMFHGGHRVRDGTLAHASVASSRQPIRRVPFITAMTTMVPASPLGLTPLASRP